MGRPVEIDDDEIAVLARWHNDHQYDTSSRENYLAAEYHRVRKEKFRDMLKPKAGKS
jgi:hypothetical protein